MNEYESELHEYASEVDGHEMDLHPELDPFLGDPKIGVLRSGPNTVIPIGTGSSTLDVFVASRLERGLSHVEKLEWRTDVTNLRATDGVLIASHRWQLADSIILERAACLIHLMLSDGEVTARVAADSPERATRNLESLKKAFPKAPIEAEDDRLRLALWWHDARVGATSFHRRVPVDTWPEIERNYSATTREALRRLMAAREEDFGTQGRIIIWHGPPGTGKTHAIRALARRWRDWCRLSTVVDPEALFGDASYLFEVVTTRDDEEESQARSNLIVLEDTGELLSADAKQRTGQGLSRLLNICDGIAGQGLRPIVLITTNEPIDSLHSAVTRPGRCAAQVRFDPLRPAEASAWLAHHGQCDESVDAPITVAELYARMREPLQANDATGSAPRRIGFTA